MSWNAYTDNLVATGKIDKAVIYSAAGDSIWATTNNLALQANEIGEIVQGFANPSGLQANGLHAQGQKYFLLRADGRSIYGKHDAEGIVIVKSTQTILIAHYPAGVQPGDATTVVEKLVDYLISVGY